MRKVSKALESSGTDGLVDAVVQVAFETMAVLNRLSAENDLSPTQFRALAILRGRRVRMAELATYLGLEKSTLSGLIDRAEQRRLVERAPNPVDGRAIDVYLSAAGKALANDLGAQVRAALTPMTGALRGPERQRLQALLEQMLSTGRRVLPTETPGAR